MNKKILTLDNLYEFYSSRGKNAHFNAKNDGDRIVVSVKGDVNFAKNEKDIEGLCPVHLQACHILDNVNRSYISEESMQNALPSFSNRPILGYIYKDGDGNYQFRDHAMHMEDDELIHDEKCIGVIPESCNAHLEYDEKKDKTYVNVDGYIFEEYSQAKEILERDGECSVSVELSIRELSYNAKDKLLVLEDFYFDGVTILGKWENGEDVLPGMQGSNIRISDFKMKNLYSDETIAMLSEIKEKLDQLTINSQRKEEDAVEFKENVEATETSDEITVVGETTDTEETVEETETEEFTEEVADTKAESEETEDVTPDENSEEEKFSKTFEISHEDIRCALYNLLAPYEEEDNDWYCITAVFDDHFIYEGWFNETNKYSQGYKKDGDNISFDGERIHMNVEYLTDNELVRLNEMRSNYAEISEKLAKYEAEPEKMSIIESEEYSSISDAEDYIAFKSQDAHFDLSVDEVRAKCDEMLLNAAKAGKVDFAKSNDNSKKEIGMKKLPVQKSKKSGRYGSIFSK